MPIYLLAWFAVNCTYNNLNKFEICSIVVAQIRRLAFNFDGDSPWLMQIGFRLAFNGSNEAELDLIEVSFIFVDVAAGIPFKSCLSGVTS